MFPRTCRQREGESERKWRIGGIRLQGFRGGGKSERRREWEARAGSSRCCCRFGSLVRLQSHKLTHSVHALSQSKRTFPAGRRCCPLVAPGGNMRRTSRLKPVPLKVWRVQRVGVRSVGDCVAFSPVLPQSNAVFPTDIVASANVWVGRGLSRARPVCARLFCHSLQRLVNIASCTVRAQFYASNKKTLLKIPQRTLLAGH